MTLSGGAGNILADLFPPDQSSWAAKYTAAILPTVNSRLLHGAINQSRLHLYPDAGHGFLFQDEPAFVKLIEHFLAAPAARAR